MIVEEPKLKPCPFCGGEASFDVRKSCLAMRIKHKEYCIDSEVTCHVYGYYRFDITAKENEVILGLHKANLAKQWNRRDGCMV